MSFHLSKFMYNPHRASQMCSSTLQHQIVSKLKPIHLRCVSIDSKVQRGQKNKVKLRIKEKQKRKRFSAMEKRIVGARQKWRCGICNSLLNAAFQCDHIIPLHLNGTNLLFNIQALCGSCHNEKSYLETYNHYNRKNNRKNICENIHEEKKSTIYKCPTCLKNVSTYFDHECEYGEYE